MIRFHSADPKHLAERLGALIDESITVLEVASGAAWRAGEIRAAHYHRKTAALSLADCVLLAVVGPGDEVATSDGVVAATAIELGIGVIPLPGSNGRRPRV